MPRKRRTDKARRTAPLSPAWAYALMTGAPANVRLPGWVTFEQAAAITGAGVWEWTDAAEAVWQAHGEALTEDAETHGFRSYAETGTRPTGEGFERWETVFMARHQY